MNTSKTLLSGDTLKAICQYAFGAITFGVYNQYTNNKITELYNETQELHDNIFMEKMEYQHKKEFQELKDKLNLLEQKRWWWF